tara:strand:- start:436 stop:1263 length:828 start_codon:yes stop_codon:yes gene_type:complete
MKLWIITVNFRNTSATRSLIDSLSCIDNCELDKIGIADNSTTSNSISELNEIVENTAFDIKIFPNKKNLYYWPAVKKVIKDMKKINKYYPDWIIVCNNDIVFSNKDFFEKLKEIDNIKFPIIGPNIVNSYGKKFNPFMVSPLSRIQNFFWKLYFISYEISILMIFAKRFLRFFYKKESKLENDILNRQVYAVHGSAVLFSKWFFINGGFLDDNFEMYGEEITLAAIAEKLNLPITYFPQLKVTHYEHSSTKLIDKRLLYNKAKKSHKYFQSIYLQ